MTEFTLVMCRGVGEQRGAANSMLGGAARMLPPGRFAVVDLDYSASYGVVGPEPFGRSQEDGRRLLLHALGSLGPVVLWGYSGGARLAGDIAAAVGHGQHPDVDLRAVGLVADPGRDRRQMTGQRRAGWGITGERFIPSHRFPVWQLSAPGDGISELPAGNPLRSFADLTEYLGGDLDEWFLDVAGKITSDRLQRWWDLENWATWLGATAWLKGYLLDGRHTCYGVERMAGEPDTYMERLVKLTAAL